ncbi:MAG: DNA translocase FtsK 4TM domain-containing protein, partial [Planctomycetaceae bacterium]|nr:DNA translocase FtsK 4TM domain-containing protein [Planctomycetaceae bacterium]
MIDYQRLKTDLAALGLFACLLFVALSVISFSPYDAPATSVYPTVETVENLCGPVGARAADLFMNGLGYSCYILIVAAFVFDLRLFSTQPIRDLFLRTLGICLIVFSVATFLNLFLPGLGKPGLYGSGGRIGAMGVLMLEKKFSLVGSCLVLTTLMFAGLMLAAEFFAIALLKKFLLFPVIAVHSKIRPAQPNPEEVKRKTLLDMPLCEPVRREEKLASRVEEDFDDEPVATMPFKVNPPAASVDHRRQDEYEEEVADPLPFELPPLELLEEAEDFPYELLAKKAQLAAATLEKTFQEFNLNVKVSEIDTGPVVTQFELDLEPGLRVNKVTALADDLAIALRVPAVRIVSPIPGKNTVGVEVPNDKQVMVRLKELIENSQEESDAMRLPLFLGKDVAGR